MIIDGWKMAAEVLARAKARADGLSRRPKVVAIAANESPATRSYLAIKEKRAAEAGCELEVRRFAEDASTAALRAAVLSAAETADAVIVQLPLPARVDAKAVCDAIPPEKDADVLSSATRERFEKVGEFNSPDLAGGRRPLLPPVVAAARKIFEENDVDLRAKRAVVLGAGFLVGAPVAAWLAQQGAEAQVLTIETSAEEKAAALRAAAIIVSVAGSPHFIKPDMLTPGAVLIDAGASELGGELVGDADPACAEVASLFTPVPGGVGPLAVACLFENVVTLAESAMNS